jgi:hypothetical protein
LLRAAFGRTPPCFYGLLDPVATQGIRDVRGAKIEGTRTGNY